MQYFLSIEDLTSYSKEGRDIGGYLSPEHMLSPTKYRVTISNYQRQNRNKGISGPRKMYCEYFQGVVD